MKTKYEKIYPHLCSLAVNDFFKSYKIVKESFIFQGSGNWDIYYTKKDKRFDYSMFENVELIGFDTLKEVNNFDITKNKIIDFSREHIFETNVEKYFLLVQR